MSQIEHRVVIRDDYNVKHYEIVREGGAMLIYDYGLVVSQPKFDGI